MTIRDALPGDVEALVGLADRQRARHAEWAPVFHRPAADAADVHRPWLASLVERDEVCVLVHEDELGGVDGFVIATLVPAPPVYDPGGMTCSIDDYTVAYDGLWSTVGVALLTGAQEWARARDAVQVVVVVSPRDTAKRDVLIEAGLFVVTEWLTAPI